MVIVRTLETERSSRILWIARQNEAFCLILVPRHCKIPKELRLMSPVGWGK